MKKLVLSVCVLSGVVEAQIQLGNPVMQGNGCPAGTANAALSPDGSTLSIVFDEFNVDAGTESPINKDRKTCTFSLPLTIPKNTRLMSAQMFVRGYGDLVENSLLAIDTQSNWGMPGKNNPNSTFVSRYIMRGPSADVFEYAQEIKNGMWSSCAQKQTLQFKTTLRLEGLRNVGGKMLPGPIQGQSYGSLDSADLGGDASIAFNLKLVPCR